MWLKLIVFISLSTILFVQARTPHYRRVPAKKASTQDQLKVDNPVKEIIKLLDGDQKKEFIKLATSNRGLKKSDAKTKVDEFVSKLTDDQKDHIKKINTRIEKQQENMDKEVKELSNKAQNFYDQITKIIKDDSITKKEEKDKIAALLKSADKGVLAEFTKKHIQLPGTSSNTDTSTNNPHFHRGPGGFVGVIYFRLSRKQKMQLNKIIVQRNKLTKKDIRQQINDFVNKLSNELQTKFKAAKDDHKKKMIKDKETVKTMSKDAQTLYEDVMKVEKNGSITFRQEEIQICKIIKKADKKIIDEFRTKGVSLPTLQLKPKDTDSNDQKSDDKDSKTGDKKNPKIDDKTEVKDTNDSTEKLVIH